MSSLLRCAWRGFTSIFRSRVPASLAWVRRDWIERAVAGIGEAMIATDRDSRVMFLNAHAEALTKWPLARAYGRPIRDVLPLSDERTRTPVDNPIPSAVSEGHSTEWMGGRVLVADDGREIAVEYRAAPIQDPHDQVKGAVLLLRDISGRKRIREAMAQLAAIVECSDDAIVGVALDGTITNWNAGAQRLYDYRADEIVGRPFALLYPPDRTGDLERVWQAIRAGESIRHFDSVRQRRDGTRLSVSVSLSPIRDERGQVVGFSSISRDVTERNRSEAEKRRTELLHRLADAQEEERRRLARELHDGMSQYLVALKLEVERMRLGPHDPEQLQRLLELTKEVGQETRRIALELRPAALDDLGLKTALVNYVEEWAERSGIDVDFQDTGLDGVRFPRPIETALYRVVQEALTNVLKHARARRVTVILERRDEDVQMIVEDDGRGFDYDAAIAPAGARQRLGLLGMRERVAALGGSLQVETAPGAGASLFIRVPLAVERR